MCTIYNFAASQKDGLEVVSSVPSSANLGGFLTYKRWTLAQLSCSRYLGDGLI